MLNTPQPRAFLHNLKGTTYSTHELNVSACYQECVDVGAMAASEFFGNMADCALHEHVAVATHAFVFMTSPICRDPQDLEARRAAFIAGYLGRIQQQLRPFDVEQTHEKHSANNGSLRVP